MKTLNDFPLCLYCIKGISPCPNTDRVVTAGRVVEECVTAGEGIGRVNGGPMVREDWKEEKGSCETQD